MSEAIDLRALTIRELLQLQVQLLIEHTELLTDIREGLVVEAAESHECPHPEELRVYLSTLSDPNHWVCRGCRYDSKADAQMN